MSVESVELSTKQHRAALLVAEDELTNIEIATLCGVTDRTLDRWKKVPEFQAAVTAHIDALSRDLSRYAIARKDKRVAALQSRWEPFKGIVAERAKKGVADTETSAEMRALEKQAAQEAGQWTEKRELSGTLSVDHGWAGLVKELERTEQGAEA